MNSARRGVLVRFAARVCFVLAHLCCVALWGQDAAAPGTDAEMARLSPQALKARAESGDGRAQNEWGLAYASGRAGETNYVLAREWFAKAAEKGVPAAQHNLASLYLTGRGVPQSFEEALDLYQKAADRGFVQSQFALGWMYANGRGVEPDFKQAAKWYGMAADQGDPQAQLHLGLLYLRGENLQPQYIEAYKWINVAAGNGNATAARRRAQLNAALSREEIRAAQAQASEYLMAKARERSAP